MGRDQVISDRKPKRERQPVSRPGPALEIPATLFDDETARRVVDDWIVPALVEEFLQWHNKQPSSECSNNDKEGQP